MKCELCGKTPRFGHNVSHSKRRTNRTWQPNVQTATVMIGNVMRRVRACTRCLRTLQKTK